MGNGNVHRIKVLLASLVTVIAAIADIYIIVNAPKNYILLGITSVVLLVAVYLVISGKMQLRDSNNLKVEEKYNNLLTSQKACYLQVKKSFRETGGKINELDNKIAPIATAGEVNHKKISGLLDALMQDQKKVAKLTVSRSKENANAMMNSNDKVIEEMSKMQEAMNGIVQQMSDKNENDQSEEFMKVEERQQELLEKMQHLEDSIKSQIETAADKFQQMPKIEKELISEMKSESEVESTVSIETEEAILKESLAEELEAVVEEPEAIAEELEAIVEEPEAIAEELEAIVEEPEAIAEELEAIVEEPEAIAEELEAVVEEPEAIAEELEAIVEEPETIAEEALEAVVEEPEPIVEEAIEEPEEVTVEESESAMPQSNKMLTPEEIAALIQGSRQKEVFPETVEETVIEEPAIEAASVEEHTAMPELSDPNRKMTPEDIAALIANM